MSEIITVLSDVDAPEVVQPVVYSPVPPEFIYYINKRVYLVKISTYT